MTGEGALRRRGAGLWAWAAIGVLVWLVLVVRVRLLAHRGRHVGGDFTIFWTSGQHLRLGTSPYVPVVGRLGFVYPPFALVPFAGLSWLPLHTAYLVWLGVAAGCVALVVLLAVRRGMSWPAAVGVLVLVLLNGYVVRAAWFGQLGLVLVGLVAADVAGAGRRRGAGVLTGIAVGLKFTPAVLVVYFLARRQWRAVGNMLAGFVGSVVLGFLVSPHWSRWYWTDLLVHHSLGTGVPTWFGSSNNQGLGNAVAMMLGSITPGHLHVGRAVALLVGVVAVAAGARAAVLGRVWLASGVLGIASCLVTSSTWDHHYVWFVLLLVAAASGELRRMWGTWLVLVVWTVWSFTLRWPHLMYVPLGRLSAWQLTQAVATPVLAALFCIVCLAELVIASRPEQEQARQEQGAPASAHGHAGR